MSKLISEYTSLYLYCMFTLILIGLMGIAVYYKPISDAAAYIVEVIEVNEGMNELATTKINNLKTQLTKAVITVTKEELTDQYKTYNVTVSTTITVPVIKLEIPLSTTKSTKRVLW